MPNASVIIPAHNEARVIGRCLDALDLDATAVVVIANGCSDDTAAVARGRGVTVIELDTASKVAALNAGDAACDDIFPRVYLDADIVLSPGAVPIMAHALERRSSPAVCAPRADFDLRAASRTVRLFYSMYTKMPYVTAALVGSGCYAVNSSGRSRWDAFPELTADDLFVQGLFDESERTVVSACWFRIVVPRTFRGLLRVRTRTYQGNRQAASAHSAGSMSSTRGSSLREAVRLVRSQPTLLPSMVVYLATNAVAAVRSRLRGTAWLTDSTSRS